MDFSVVEDLSTYDAEALAAKITEGEDALNALLDLESPTEDDVTAAERVVASLRILRDEQSTRATAAAARAGRMAAVREAASVAPVEVEVAEPTVEPEPVVEPEPAPVAAPVAAASTAVATLSGRVARPVVASTPQTAPITITAAADVSGWAAGTTMNDMNAVAEGFMSKARSFPTTFAVKGAAQQRYPVAQFHLDFPEELTASGESRDFDVVMHAGDERRLPNGSLTAAGGWCAPSETLYDLCGGGSLEGLWNVPEMNVGHGGVRFTRGPDFSALYSAGFYLTEAQVIAGTAKTCYEVPCPPFVEQRLDAAGICLTTPLLTEAGYPELVAAFQREALIAHQHAVAGKMLTAALALATAAGPLADRGSSTSNLLDTLEFVATIVRTDFRLGESTTVEVTLPWWVKANIRADLSMRTGVDLISVGDGTISAYFSSRGLNVQFVHNWQALEADATGYPATVDALIYPSGTFVKGTADVINLDAVYDAASLKQNTRVALFYEQGVMLIQKCWKAYKITVDLCASGITGAASNEECLTGAVGP